MLSFTEAFIQNRDNKSCVQNVTMERIMQCTKALCVLFSEISIVQLPTATIFSWFQELNIVKDVMV